MARRRGRPRGLYRVFASTRTFLTPLPEAVTIWQWRVGAQAIVTQAGAYVVGRSSADRIARMLRGYKRGIRVERVDPAVLAAFSGATRASIVALMARERGIVE